MAVNAKACDCGHGVSWHKLFKQSRLLCDYVGCKCRRYSQSGMAAGLPSVVGPVAMPRPVTSHVAVAQPVAQVPNHLAPNSEFMLDLAAQALMRKQLNRLSKSAFGSLASLGRNKGCYRCTMAWDAEHDVESYRSYVTRYARQQTIVSFNEHLTIQHIASLFEVDTTTLRRAAYDKIVASMNSEVGDDERADPSTFVGWRSYSLVRSNGLLGIKGPTHTHSMVNQVFTTRDLYSMCPSGESRAPEAMRATSAQHVGAEVSYKVDPGTLEVSTVGKRCDCGLYAWTTDEDFIANNYRDFSQLTANVRPYGAVRMGEDQRSLKASDMYVERFVVYCGGTAVDGAIPVLNSFWGSGGGQRMLYAWLCEQLVNQFHVPVDLVATAANHVPSARLELIERFIPQTAESLFIK